MRIRFPRNILRAITVIIFLLLQGSLLLGKSNNAGFTEIGKVSINNIHNQRSYNSYQSPKSSEVQWNINYRNKRCLHEDDYRFFACLFTTIKVYPRLQINLTVSKILQRYYYCNISLIFPRAPPYL